MGTREWSFLGLGLVAGSLLTVAGTSGILVSSWTGPSFHGSGVSGVPAQEIQNQTPAFNPQELVPFPNGALPGTGQQPALGQDCGKILFYYQGRLYQLQPGPTPRNGGNPEFYFMQPYQGPGIPGFPSPFSPSPSPDQQGQPLPPPLKF